MAYSYKGSISFGLVNIPVTLHNSIKENDIGFNMIDKNTMSRVKYKKTCADCEGREVKQEDIVKGYEYEEGKYVIFEESACNILCYNGQDLTSKPLMEHKEVLEKSVTESNGLSNVIERYLMSL